MHRNIQNVLLEVIPRCANRQVKYVTDIVCNFDPELYYLNKCNMLKM